MNIDIIEMMLIRVCAGLIGIGVFGSFFKKNMVSFDDMYSVLLAVICAVFALLANMIAWTYFDSKGNVRTDEPKYTSDNVQSDAKKSS